MCWATGAFPAHLKDVSNMGCIVVRHGFVVARLNLPEEACKLTQVQPKV